MDPKNKAQEPEFKFPEPNGGGKGINLFALAKLAVCFMFLVLKNIRWWELLKFLVKLPFTFIKNLILRKGAGSDEKVKG